MRIAVVSDIHGNLTALEAVIADLRAKSPDLVLHGGDLADGGARPAEVVDRVADLGWSGVMGNTDEMIFNPDALTEFAQGSNARLQPILKAIGEMAAFTREKLGGTRIEWLRQLPRSLIRESLALVHATPEDLWRAPGEEAPDAELESAYRKLGRLRVVYGHIHRPIVRKVGELRVANTGSVGLPYDGDQRAAYLLLDDADVVVRRVAYNLDQELKAIAESGLPHADWVARTLQTARPQMP